MALHGRATLRTLQQGIDSLTAFNVGNVSGTPGATDTGRMPEEAAKAYKAARDAGTIVYTVRSHYTPIAYKTTDEGWIVPDARYSATTSGHQGRVRVAIGNHGFYDR